MIQALNRIQAVYYIRAGYMPWKDSYERKTYVATPDEGYRGGIVSTIDRGAQI